MKPTGYLAQYNEPLLTAENMVFFGEQESMEMDTYATESSNLKKGRRVISLDGAWNYAIDQYDTCLRQKWFLENYVNQNGLTFPVDYSFDSWPTMELPCSSNLTSEQLFLYEAPLVFTRKFMTPEGIYADFGAENGAESAENSSRKPRKRVILRIGAANYATRIFVNGKNAGFHLGGSTPMFADITELLNTEEDCEQSEDKNVRLRGRKKGENRIVIVTDATRREEWVPALETDWFNYAGIYRNIDLLILPATYIKKFEVNLVPDGTFSKIRVKVRLGGDVFGEASSEGCEKVALCHNDGRESIGIFEIYDKNGKNVLTEKVNIENGEADTIVNYSPMLWSPENPELYTVKFSCFHDTVVDKTGFREIKVVGHDIILNGRSVFLRGICMHEDSRFTGKALTVEERRQAIKDAKEMGCNFMRVAHYPHSEVMSRLADEMGMLLWEEIPVYWGILFGDPDTYADAENQLSELITRDYNRPSVIIWSVGNENADMDDRFIFMGALVDKAHEMDETRLVSAACLVDGYRNQINDRLAARLDVIGINEYYGWYDPDFSRLPQMFENSKPDKPVIITEFGADAMPGHHGGKDEKGTLECQEEVFKLQAGVLPGIPYIRGTSPWILYDFRCPRRTSSIQLYYNRKGLICDDRVTRKPAFYVMQDLYRKLREKWEGDVFL